MSDWISVKEKLPKCGRDVVVVARIKGVRKVMAGWYHKHLHVWRVEYGNSGKTIFCGVTHWMPLPELPKED